MGAQDITQVGGAGAGLILDTPYNPATWIETDKGASRKSIKDKIESMGFLGPVAYVDNLYGNDTSAVLGNLLKPFKTHSAAMGQIGFPAANAKSLIVTLPGTYSITDTFGFPLRNNVDHLLINCDLVQTGFAYGILMVYPSAVNCKIVGVGNVNLINNSSNADWASVTPYVSCNLDIQNLNIIGSKQLIGQQGSIPGSDILVKFTNCNLYANDNIINRAGGGGFVRGSALFTNCFLKGHLSVYNSEKSPQVGYKTKFVNCELDASVVNTSGEVSSLGLFDYSGNTDLIYHVLDRCKFSSNVGAGQNIDFGEGALGIGANKNLIIQNCDFINLAGGWIVNNHPTALFYLRNNWTKNNATGTTPVINTLTGTGVITDSNLLNY